MSKHPLWRVWRAMMQRCYDKNAVGYANYGGRGIAVCLAWHSCEQFYSDMLPSWRDGLQIERRDNDKGYEPNNCTWATRKEQARNRRSSRFIEYRGHKRTLVEWSEVAQMPVDRLGARLALGWPMELAISLPKYAKPVLV